MAGANMARNESLAGQSVKQGGYTVTYDKNGYATKSVKDGGASATSTKKTTHANDSAAHQEAYQAAQRGDWDAVGNAINKISDAGPVDAYGQHDLTDANKYLSELADEFGYNSKNYYDKKYEQAYGDGASKQSGTIAGTGGAAGGAAPAAGGSGWNDASQYLKEMYAQKNAAELAALKASYDQNVLDYQAQGDRISEQAQLLRNQAAAQNDIQRMYMNEMGIAHGLNTGTTGQMALAQSANYQGNLAGIGTQEAQSLADNDLALAKLKAQYTAAVDQAVADGNYQMAQALYNEYVRQDELARQAAANAQEQANWLAKFNYQKEQDALAQQNWQAQYDYQKQQDALDYKLALQKMNAKNASNRGTKKIMSAPNKSTQRVVVPNADTGIQVKPLDYSAIVKNSEAGNYGPKYGLVLGNVQAQLARGADLAAISDIIKRAVDSGDINDEGANTILQAFGY